ncbi:MAG: hypothetical protein Q9187_001353 [Circinaria calcarea]
MAGCEGTEGTQDEIIRVLGLSHTLNTKVGNDFVIGVSGGERKRTSLAGEGKDSTLLFWIIIFFGDATTAKAYFTNLGFICSDRSTTADFLTSVTNPAERIVQHGYESRVPRTPCEFLDHWTNSPERSKLVKELEEYEKKFPPGSRSAKDFLKSGRQWFGYLNPVAYAFESLMINEFHNRQFPCVKFVPDGPEYGNVRSREKACTVLGAQAGASTVDGDKYLAIAFEYYPSNLWR